MCCNEECASIDLPGELGEQGGKIDNPIDFLVDMSQLDKFEQKMVRTKRNCS